MRASTLLNRVLNLDGATVIDVASRAARQVTVRWLFGFAPAAG